MSATFRVNFQDFDRALGQYMQYTKRSLPDVLNKKGFYIAKKAMENTKIASGEKIRSELGTIVKVKMRVKTKRGMRLKSVKTVSNLTSAGGRRSNQSLAEVILRARYYKKGKEQPTKSALPHHLVKLIGARVRSIAFIKSGWLPAMRKLWPMFDHHLAPGGKPRQVKQVGSDKGNAIPARNGWNVKVVIENSATGAGTFGGSAEKGFGALVKYGEPALQAAVHDETASMKQHTFERMREDAKKCAIKVMG